MMSSTLGAPLGGTTRGAHQASDSEALSLITPPNGVSGGGKTRPSITVVAEGEPSVPVICCAQVKGVPARAMPVKIPPKSICFIGFICDCEFLFLKHDPHRDLRSARGYVIDKTGMLVIDVEVAIAGFSIDSLRELAAKRAISLPREL